MSRVDLQLIPPSPPSGKNLKPWATPASTPSACSSRPLKVAAASRRRPCWRRLAANLPLKLTLSRPIRDRMPGLTKDIAAVIDQALVRNPKDRFPDAGKLLGAMRK
jgi:hypothetical protein